MKKTAKKTSSSKASVKKQHKKARKLSTKKKLTSASAPKSSPKKIQQTPAPAMLGAQQQAGHKDAEAKPKPTSKPKLKADATLKSVNTVASDSLLRTADGAIQEKPHATPNRAVFFFFLAIFACMLLLESTRFKVYFEGESGEYPFLRPVGEYIAKAAERSGVQGVMDTLGQWTGALSQEYLIVAHEGFVMQWHEAKAFYAAVLGLDVTSPEQQAQEPQQTEQAATTAKEPLPSAQEPISTDTQSDATKETLIEKVAREEAVKEETTKEEAVTAVLPDAPIAPPVSYAFYDSARISKAPSAAGIEEYLTKLPDYGKKVKVLLIGDSMMMEGLGPTLQKSLRKRADLEVVREGRYSSGLSKPDFFNWPENLKKLLAKHNPDLLIISLGANDTQDIMVGKKRFRIDTEGWERVYAIRVINFLELATENNRKVLWASLPVMGRMPYANRTKLINAITEEMSAFYPAVRYENIEHLLTQDGKYTSFIKDKNNKTIRLRSKDNIHVSTAGGQILTNYLLPHAAERVGRIRWEEVGENPYIPVAGRMNRVQFTSALLGKKVTYNVYLPNISTSEIPDAERHAGIAANILAVQPTADNSQSITSVVDLVHQSLQQLDFAEQKSGKKSGQKPAKAQGFPVLYILHGATGHGDDWNKYMGQELQAIANDEKVMVVAPVIEGLGWYMDSPKVVHSQIESFIVKELVPHVDMLFPTSGKRAVAGISMGGHGAVMLGFKYPKIFQSVASVSGVLDIRRYPERWGLSELLGDYEQNKVQWDKNTALHVMEKSKISAAPKQFLLVTGLQDILVLEDHKKAQALLEKRKISFDYEELEGGHEWEFWIREMPKVLRKQAEYLNI